MKAVKFWGVIFTCLSIFCFIAIPASGQVVTDGVMVNLSTRGYVGTGDNVMIAGFCISDSLTIIIRALGPSLRSRGVHGALADPRMDIYDSRGHLLVSNDDWQEGYYADILFEMGLAPSNPNESAIIGTADRGCYTVVVSGVGGTTGVALVEVYDIREFEL